MKKPFLLFFFILNLYCLNAQNPVSDCSGAIKICGDGAISSNADGAGIQELNGSNNCSSSENNSLWLEIEITKAGSLGFELIPTSSDINIDYDFFIFGPNATCGNLDFAIRCSTTNPAGAGAINNHTGMNDLETDISEGPGPDGNSFVKSLDVLPGETYFIVIDRPIGNSPFSLNWTGSATVGGYPFPEGPEINEAEDLQTCNANGLAEFDLSQNNSSITTQNNTTLTYHESLADASDNLMTLRNNYTSNEPKKTIYARVENDLTGCFKITEFDLIINDGPLIEPALSLEECDLDRTGEENYTLTDTNAEIISGLDASSYDIEYFASEADARQNLNTLANNYSSAGNETIYARVSEVSNPDCYNISEIELILNAPPEIDSYNIVQPSVNSNNNTVEISLPNASEYEYSIGNIDGPYQTSTTFQNVASGFKTLYIRDFKQCAIISTEIAILGYDNFFTPNQDGINDFWQLNGITPEFAADNQIHIYDRYGKLLKKLNASENGWDGTFDGNDMPADDYWFKVHLQNGQEFNGHFSLVR
ncbi:T9SS type B sorting domain-containing protein [Christiangramia sediminis]|uniref:T9SS type B sorting domain-containing protein n=1 Tax=Christiangramia sediminis TaxID=2881336 RepID=A0A9X1RXD0_9FLAO|nr:T9SS type B sorting domain-containing protein [Christiangramia sediminis]MCB7480859.1 T9SS type B sorting domain-containing protein [Christiangramia sediminis]